MKVSAVDATHSRHHVYSDGRLHILSTYDGDDHMIPLAWMWAETESGDTYQWFAEHCIAAGLGRYLNKASVLFSDRQKGIDKFTDAFEAIALKCFWHVVKNCTDHIKGSYQTFSSQLAWQLQRAPTREDFLKVLRRLKKTSPKAAEYLNNQTPHSSLYTYAFTEKGYPTHNCKVASAHSFSTSQLAECANWALAGARNETPYRSNAWILRWMGEKFSERTRYMEKWISQNHMLTPYAYQLWQCQVPCAPPTLCPTHLVPHAPCAPPTLCPTHLVPRPPCAPPTLCPTHLVPHAPCAPGGNSQAYWL